MEGHRSVYFVDKDGKTKLLTDEIWNALSSGSDEDLDNSDEDPTFNPNVLLNRNQEENCPYVITTYNKHMGGVDLLDSLIGRYKIIMRSKK